MVEGYHITLLTFHTYILANGGLRTDIPEPVPYLC